MYRFFLQLLIAGMGCLVTALPCLSQQASTPPARRILKISPQHFLVSGLHLSFEKSLPHNSYQSLVFAPHVYFGNTALVDSWSDRYKEANNNGEVTGYGAEVQHRLYIRQLADASSKMPYLAYGFSYSAFQVDFDREGWYEELETDGLQYYRYTMRPFKETINRMGVSVLAGVQGPFLSQHILMDLYIGVGYKHSRTSTDFTAPRYNQSVMDFGYTGLQPLIGANLGFAF